MAKKSKKNSSLKSNTGIGLNLVISTVLAFSLLGGIFMYQSFATSKATVPSEFITRTYVEGVGRIPSQGAWNKWKSYYKINRCTQASLSKLLDEVYTSREYSDLGYSSKEKVFTLYRGVLSREPDATGYNYWVKRLDKDGSVEKVLAGLTASSEFKRMATTYCNSVNYEFKGSPFAISKTTDSEVVQRKIDSASAGSTVYLEPGELVSMNNPILVKRGVTLATKGSNGIKGRHAYAKMARIVATKPNPVVVMPGAKLNNVWIDGQAWKHKTNKQKNNVRIFPTSVESKVENVRTDNSTGAQNIMVFGLREHEYSYRTGQPYQGDKVCMGTPVVAGNLVVNSANLHTSDRWSDGIATSCPQTTIKDNEVIDASDVGILTYRTYGSTPQKSQVYGNRILNAGNSVFGGIAADPLSLQSQDLQQYPDCMKYGAPKDPHCDFTGLSFRNNTLWSGPDVHFVIGVSVGTRAWGFFQPDSTTGSGASFTNNGNGISAINVAVPLYVSGMNNAIVKDNFTTQGIFPPSGTARKCKPSKVQLYNPDQAKNLNATNMIRSTSTTQSDAKFLLPVNQQTTRDKCI